jgi:hypothetical protein
LGEIPPLSTPPPEKERRERRRRGGEEELEVRTRSVPVVGG